MRWTLILAEPGHGPAPPWHDLAAVARHIVATLPGTVFDGAGIGRFAARTYTVTFHLPAADPGVLEVEATDAAAEPAILRVARKAGWGVIDEHGRAAAALGATGVTPAASSPARHDRSQAATGSLLKAGLAVAVALAVTVAGGLRWAQLQRDAAAAAAAPTPAPAPVPEPIAGSRGRTIERFRDNAVVVQLVAYAEAAAAFQKQHGRDTWVDPAALAWGLRRAGELAPSVDAFLPPTFRTAERDGYRFTFEGRLCSSDPPKGFADSVPALEVTRCQEGIYIAQPVDLGQPSFAFHSADWRIRFREDAVPPSPGDAVVANLDPKVADAEAAAPVTIKAAPATAPAWVGNMWGMWERAVGATPPRTTVARANPEGPVEADLRAVAAAQKLYARQVGRGHFTDLRRLMHPVDEDGRSVTPMLNPAFATPERHGYRFELIGTPTSDDWTTRVGPALGPHYGAFVYVAHPLDPGGRTLAVLTDGGIRVATGRVPTAEDPRLGAPLAGSSAP